jgi:DNA-binding SARP family transcriptional activator
VEVRLLGELQVLRDGTPMALPASKRTRALLGFLAATAQPHLREKLCELFWDGPDDPRAALRWSLTKLRPVIGDQLRADRERVELSASSDLMHVRQIDCATASVADLRNAASRFRGELLDGLDLPDCFRYQAWCAAERESARSLRLAVYDALAQKDSPEEAPGWARTRLAVDPLSEAAHVQLMRALLRVGRARDALKQYDEARRLLTEELGGIQGVELERARQECLRSPAAEPAPVIAAAAPAQVSAPISSMLAGRKSERAAAQSWTAAAAAAERHGLGLFVGEPGIGKSRLLEELSTSMRAAGGRVLFGRAFEAEMLRPYGAWIDALSVLQPSEIPAGSELPGAASNDRERLFGDTTRLLQSLAQPGRPLLVVLDDLQWLDESSAALLHYAVRALEDSRVLIAGGARPGELADNRAVLGTIRALDKSGRLRRIDLEPLPPSAIRELVGDVDVDRVMAASGGNPLYAREVASALRAGHDSAPLDHLLRERLERVEGRARDLLPFAAALGHSFEPAELAAASGLPAADLLAAADELERHGILRAAAGGGWDFSHDLFRDAAYRSLSEPRRRLVHLQIAQALATLPGADGARASERAQHAALGGDLEASARAWLKGGVHCARVFAKAEAEKAAQRGLQLVEKLPGAVRADLEIPLYQLLVRVKNATCTAEAPNITRAIVFAEGARRADQVSVGFELLAHIAFQSQDFQSALESTVRSVETSREVDPAVAVRASATTARCLVLIERDIPRAIQLATDAERIASKNQLKDHEVPWALGMVHHYTGNLDRAVEEHQRALRFNLGSSDHFADVICFTELACIEIERRRFAEARTWSERAVEVSAKVGEGSEGPFAVVVDALARYGEDLVDRAALDRTLAALREIDAKSLYAYACNTLAELELERGQNAAAAEAARQAMEAARVVDRKSEIALSLALLWRLARKNSAEAKRLTAELRPYLEGDAALSSRARRQMSIVFAERGS